MSSSSSIIKRPTTGFSATEVQSFLKRGGQLAGAGVKKGNQSIASAKPKMKERTTTTTRTEASSIDKFFGAKDEIQVVPSGFLGEFAQNMTAEKLDAITQSFVQRQKSIRQRRAQPGRSALFLARTA